MAHKIDNFTELNHYFSGVQEKADHHAPNVNEVIFSLAGFVIWKANGPVKVFMRNEVVANVLWFYVDNNRCVLSYNHIIGSIELRNNSLQGEVISIFNNGSIFQEIISVFDKL